MYIEERHQNILQLLQGEGRVDVTELSDKFHTSKETIRRDLKILEGKRLLIRTHGGALPPGSSTEKAKAPESPLKVRTALHVEEKKSICRYAADLIENGDTIFVDNSTTCLYLYRYIPYDMQITILTNSLSFLTECSRTQNPNHTIVCLGGMLKQPNLSVYGSMTIDNAKQYLPRKAFLSCTGIVSESFIFDSGLQEVDVKRIFLKNSAEVFLLADHSKFQPIGQVFLGDFSDITQIITDCPPDIAYLNLSKEAAKKIISVGS